MNDYRDLPIQVARRAAERTRETALRRERWRTTLRAMVWLLCAAGIAVVTVLAQPLWQPYVDGQRLREDARAVAARVEQAPLRGGAAGAGDGRGSPAGPAATADATARTASDAGGMATHRANPTPAQPAPAQPAPAQPTPAQPTPAQATAARETPPVAPPTVAAEASTADEADADATKASAQATADIENLRRRADEELRDGRLEQAAASYRAVLDRVADDEAAAEGLANVAAAHAVRAQRLAADFEFDGAERALAFARDLAPDAGAVRDASRELAQARALHARMPPTVGAAQQDRVRSLLDEAAAAMARGELMDPPGESAFDKIAAARALAPNAPEVRSAADRLERARRMQGDRSATPR